MKIFVLSDTHKKIEKAQRVYEKLSDVDLIIHCGDYQSDAVTLEDILGVPVISVKGNCDGCTKRDYKIVETPYGNILVTHGHMERIKDSYDRILYLAEEQNCIAACFGHTHVPMFEKNDGIWLINPGSLTYPRDNSNGSYAVIHATEQDFFGSVVYYDTLFGTKTGGENKKKVHGGYLRRLLNYSDRF